MDCASSRLLLLLIAGGVSIVGDMILLVGGEGIEVVSVASSRISWCLTKTLQASTAAWRRVSPMPAGSVWNISGLRSWLISGKTTSVKRMIVLWKAAFGNIGLFVLSVSTVGDRRTRWSEERDCARIWRQGFKLWVVSVRNGGDQYAAQAINLLVVKAFKPCVKVRTFVRIKL